MLPLMCQGSCFIVGLGFWLALVACLLPSGSIHTDEQPLEGKGP